MLIFVCVLIQVARVNSQHEVPPDVVRDAKSTTPELIQQYGYPVEIHQVITADGYILEMHRIPHGRDTTEIKGSLPVYLQHGFLTSSADWVYILPGHALGFVLADAGYDVWLGNFRGNIYSKNHEWYSNSSKEFWNFSWHENGVYDMPAMIDYVLAKTGSQQLFFVGHSMGTTSLFVLMSLRPEYNKTIRLACCLAPVAYINHIESKVLRKIARGMRGEESLFNAVGTFELLPHSRIMQYLSLDYCSDQAITQKICKNLLLMITGWESHQLNKTQLPIILSHSPNGASTKQVGHYAQEIISGRFCMWDYGTATNLRFYGSALPPQYNLSKVTVPTVFFFAGNDWISDDIDVRRLQRRLQNHVETITVPYKTFTHMDFIWAKDGKELVYDTVIQKMQTFS